MLFPQISIVLLKRYWSLETTDFHAFDATNPVGGLKGDFDLCLVLQTMTTGS